MAIKFSSLKEKLLKSNQRFNTNWLMAGLLAIVLGLEFSTPPAYVFGYFYTGAILLVQSHRSKSATVRVTLAACGLTLLNLVFPVLETFNSATLANRLIAVLALVVTGWLSERNRQYEEALARQQAQLQAQVQLASLREDFVSTLSHDLKTPLLGAIETIKSFQQQQFGAVTPAQQKVLEMMVRSHRTTLQLVETLLDVYHNDTEGLQLHRSSVNLVAIAEEVIATLIDLAATRQVYIRLSYGESDFRRSFWVNGDTLQLQRVFANLLTNSINHSPRGSKVEVAMQSQSAYQIVKITDDGPGMTADELPHLFERFYQGHSNRHAKGSGLGLYLTRQIIAAHDGMIWAENRLPHGAMFGFKVPAILSPEF